MKDIILSSKCCFNRFCDKCILEHIISKSMCYCGAKDMLADDLIPNRTLREAVNAMLFEKSTRSSSGNVGSSITTEASNINASRQLPPSAALSDTLDNHKCASSSVKVSLIVKENGGKKIEKVTDTCTKPLDSGSKKKFNEVLQPNFSKEIMSKMDNSDTDGIHGVVIDGGKGNKKGGKLPVDTDFSMCTLASNPGMYYPFPSATYNPCWSAGPMPLGFDGCAAYLSVGMPYVNYEAPYFPNAVVGGIPFQCPYDMQGYNFLPENVYAQISLPILLLNLYFLQSVSDALTSILDKKSCIRFVSDITVFGATWNFHFICSIPPSLMVALVGTLISI